MSDSTEHNWPLETFHYNPNKNLAIAAATGYGLLLNVLAYRLWRRRSFWAWLAPAAPAQVALGFSLRYYGVKNSPDVLALNYLSQAVIVGFVGGYTVFNYTVFRKILEAFTTGRNRYSIVQPQLAFWALTICDIVTFSAQGAGAGLRATPDHASTGRWVFLIGLIIQAITYSIFVFDRYNFPWMLLYVLYVSSLCIVIRTIYRFAELVQGNGGELFTHEKYFYGLDVLPVASAIGIYAIFWPGSLIAKATAEYNPPIAMDYNGEMNV